MNTKCETYYNALIHFLSLFEAETEFTKRLDDNRWLTVREYITLCFCDGVNGIENAISMAFPFHKADPSNYYKWCDIDRKWRIAVLQSNQFKSVSKDLNTASKSRFKSIW